MKVRCNLWLDKWHSWQLSRAHLDCLSVRWTLQVLVVGNGIELMLLPWGMGHLLLPP